ncbi:hypothetical protein DP0391 [Desulfotalea psychrophila LSv54]|uniref:AB hydrolase-1 domain-containing protein n=2 Tax=Desulfotalea psychrophila TaxID=84980 RepID=Q6ARA4_DESPS|nr:hypothetical protein DP0391 [Desulfotalea psychrophila LSv54]
MIKKYNENLFTGISMWRKRIALALILFSPCSLALGAEEVPINNECVILLHGLARTSRSMVSMEESLLSSGYRVINLDYPSRKFKIEKLADAAVSAALSECQEYSPRKVHFVTHSLGGILVRQYLSKRQIANLGRVVMLSPPNGGSEVVDKMKAVPGFFWLNGPAGQQLGTSAASIPRRLGRVGFELGVIAGNRSVNLILSLMITGEDDGKVSIENAKVEGMVDFLVLPHSHPFIMRATEVIRQTKYFLQHGAFQR